MSKLFLAASRVFGGGTVVVLALGCLLAGSQPAKAGRVEVCPVPAYCSPFACRYSWLSDGTCTYTALQYGVASCDCL